MTDDVTRILRDAYDRRVEERAMRPAPAWETAERDAFLQVLRRERMTTVLELGAATGALAVTRIGAAAGVSTLAEAMALAGLND